MKNFILFAFCTVILMSVNQPISAKSNNKTKTKRYTEYRMSNKNQKKSKSSKTYRYVDYYKQNKSKVNNK